MGLSMDMRNKNPQDLVQAFHEKFGYAIAMSLEPYSRDAQTRLKNTGTLLQVIAGRLRESKEREHCLLTQRACLMIEELGETVEALGNEDKVALADGLADLAYVTYGTGVALGIPVDLCIEEVHRSNMTKTPGEFKPHKGDDYEEPNLEKLVR